MNKEDKDFSGQNLRGRSFKGQSLRGAKFVGADIRGANFSGADLRNADFTGARAGLQLHMKIFYFLLSVALAALTGCLIMSFIAVGLSDDDLSMTEIKNVRFIAMLLVPLVPIYTVVFRSGIDVALRTALSLFAFALVVVIAAGSTIASTVVDAVVNDVAGAVIIAVAIVVIFTFAVAVVVAFAFAGAGAVAVAGVVISAVAGAFAFAIAGVGAFAIADEVAVTVIGTVAVSVVLVNIHIAWRALKGDKKQAFILRIVNALTTRGGTRFRRADISRVNFSEALLHNCDFRAAVTTQTQWRSAKKLLLARTSKTILADYDVRALLESGEGARKSFADKDLKGANLSGFDLSGADLTETDISEANLQGANLTEANLTKTQAIGAVFRDADLTGACIESWNIDHTTQLDGAICRYAYLLNGQRERQPSAGEFNENQFAQLFEQVFDTVNLIFGRNGIDWQVFSQVFGQMQITYDEKGTELAVQAIERKSDGTFVVKVKVPPEANKAAIHHEFNENYEHRLALQEAKYKALLRGKEDVVAVYREQNANMKEIVATLAQRQTINIEHQAGAIEMSERKIEISGTVIGSNLNLGDISGRVTTAIWQLPEDGAEQPGIKTLLSQLQKAVEDDSALGEKEKCLALKKVGELAEAAQSPQDNVSQISAKGVISTLFDMTKNFNEAEKFGETCQKYLPVILNFFTG